MKIITGAARLGGIKQVAQRGAALLAAAVAAASFAVRSAPQLRSVSGGAALAAVSFIFPDGGASLLFGIEQREKQPSAGQENNLVSEQETPEELPESSLPEEEPETTPPKEESSAIPEPSESSKGEEEAPGIPIQEVVIGGSGTQYGDIFVKNSNQNTEIDIASELEKEPAVKIKTDGTPQVLIYHTHTTESYLLWEQDTFPAGGETRSLDNTRNVVLVGDAIEAQLKAARIGVIHDETCHDYPSYNGSYTRSAATIQKNLEQYPTIQVTIDVHRDALGTNELRKKPTVEINGKKAAQVMILTGCDDDGTLGFPDWEQNLRLALRLQQDLVGEYPGLARPVNFGPNLYNMNLTKGSLLVEFGTEVNTLEEALYSGELFGQALARVLLSLQEE